MYSSTVSGHWVLNITEMYKHKIYHLNAGFQFFCAFSLFPTIHIRIKTTFPFFNFRRLHSALCYFFIISLCSITNVTRTNIHLLHTFTFFRFLSRIFNWHHFEYNSSIWLCFEQTPFWTEAFRLFSKNIQHVISNATFPINTFSRTFNEQPSNEPSNEMLKGGYLPHADLLQFSIYYLFQECLKHAILNAWFYIFFFLKDIFNRCSFESGCLISGLFFSNIFNCRLL